MQSPTATTEQADIQTLSAGPFVATPVGLREIDQNVSFDAWREYGRGLKRVEGAIQWLIGDWLNFGEKKYGEKYEEALKLWPEYEFETLRMYKWVSHWVHLYTRVYSLSWSHHRVVAKLDMPTQSYWLKLAAKNGWSVKRLKEEMNWDEQDDGDEEEGETHFTWAKHEYVIGLMETAKAGRGYVSSILKDGRDPKTAAYYLGIARKLYAESIDEIDRALGGM